MTKLSGLASGLVGRAGGAGFSEGRGGGWITGSEATSAGVTGVCCCEWASKGSALGGREDSAGVVTSGDGAKGAEGAATEAATAFTTTLFAST
jgi:hypothetical protein